MSDYSTASCATFVTRRDRETCFANNKQIALAHIGARNAEASVRKIEAIRGLLNDAYGAAEKLSCSQTGQGKICDSVNEQIKQLHDALAVHLK